MQLLRNVTLFGLLCLPLCGCSNSREGEVADEPEAPAPELSAEEEAAEREYTGQRN